MKLGKKIQHYRKMRALSQEALGKQLFVTRQTVSLWEKDQTLPSLDNIVRLADIFGITVDELLSEKQTDSSSAEAFEAGGAEKPVSSSGAQNSAPAQVSADSNKSKKAGKLSRGWLISFIAAAAALAVCTLVCILVFSSPSSLSDRRISRAIATELPRYEKKVALNTSGKPGGVISVTEITFGSDVFEQLSQFMSSSEPTEVSDMLTQSFLHTGGSLYCLYNEDLGERTVSKFRAKYLLAVYYSDSNMLRVTEFEY